ncbi:MAG TPA: HEAT repeat domain-containing protein [Kofleriaceae bacterium]
MTRTISTGILSALLLALAIPAAQAGRGGNFNKIRAAAQNGNPDAIVAELERAERIPCSDDCMQYILGLTAHDSYYVRDAAAWWFARHAAQKGAVAQRAVASLATGNSVEVRNAADTLGRVGHPRDIADLDAALSRSALSDEARSHVVRAIGKLAHASGAAALQGAMADTSAEVRREAVVAWSKLLRQSNAAPVAALVTDTDLSVRRAATQTVGRFREATARAALEELVVSDADAAVRRNAAWALGRIGDAGSRAALTTAASDSSSLVRMTAKAAIRQLH